ncbi:hypothetical protein LTS10_005239 [Elasticomyces elasticus]|nr:hypothetical protein LTS10_005239 [Elasticomyces elasticus]
MFLGSVGKRHTLLTAQTSEPTAPSSFDSKNIEGIDAWILVNGDDDAADDHDRDGGPLSYATSLSIATTRQATEGPRTEWSQEAVFNTLPGNAICSKTTLDPMRAVCSTPQARTEVEYQRQLLVRETVNATLDRLVELFCDPCNGCDDSDGLFSRLKSGRPTVTTQINSKQEGQMDIECSHDDVLQTPSIATKSGDPSTTRVCPAIVQEYICRAGDASIVSERLAELDGRAATQKTLATAAEGFVDFDDQARQLKDARREALESELHKALQEAESLRSQCLEQGYDPDEAKYR